MVGRLSPGRFDQIRAGCEIRPAMSGLILEFRCGLPLQAARFKIGLRLDCPHHRFHLGDHDAGFDFLLRPFPQGFTRSWQTE